MPIINRDRYPDEVFFSELDFLEIGTTANGTKIIQVGIEGDAPLVAFANTDDPISEDLDVVELWSLLKFSQDKNAYQFYDRPRKLNQKIKLIHKFKLPNSGEFTLNLPIETQILTVQIQNGEPYLWALLDPEANKYSCDFVWIRTGEEFEYENPTYITTLQFDNAAKVAHLFKLSIQYNKLEKLLSKKQWREADLETFKILGKLCGLDGGPDGSHIRLSGINKNIYADLTTIDRLWSKYSNGHFGYTTQLAILQEFYYSHTISESDKSWWGVFCKYLDWNTGFSVLNFSLDAPRGHLPAIVGWGMCWGPIMFKDIYQTLLSQLRN